ncbi:MAG: hypothetical protein R6V67_07775 [Spirochaetia bacterium]
MKKKADIKRILLIGIPLLILAVGVKFLDDEARIFWFEENETNYTSARFFLFSGEKERILKANKDGPAEISWNPKAERGSLSLEVMPPSQEEAFIVEGEPRTFTLDLKKGERVRLIVHADRAKGAFSIEWKTP